MFNITLLLLFFTIAIGLQMEVSYFVKECHAFCANKIF